MIRNNIQYLLLASNGTTITILKKAVIVVVTLLENFFFVFFYFLCVIWFKSICVVYEVELINFYLKWIKFEKSFQRKYIFGATSSL